MAGWFIFPWVIWFLWFIFWEAWGFRSNHDRWPTLSQLVKWWEGPKKVYRNGVLVGFSKVAKERGISTWTWKRWLVAVALPVAAIVLEFHWVYEWPF